jgi:hypothetical protein
MSGRFLKKATEKLPDRLAVKPPINQNSNAKNPAGAGFFWGVKNNR